MYPLNWVFSFVRLDFYVPTSCRLKVYKAPYDVVGVVKFVNCTEKSNITLGRTKSEVVRRSEFTSRNGYRISGMHFVSVWRRRFAINIELFA